MREIKFRAWDDKAKGWVEPDKFVVDPRGVLEGSKTQIYGVSDSLVAEIEGIENDDHITLEQFTGLQDKNGREIYEGDIVRLHGEESLSNESMSTDEDWTLIGKVHFDRAAFAWLVGIGHEYITFWEIGTDEIDIEVIGNIHENPELLK